MKTTKLVIELTIVHDDYVDPERVVDKMLDRGIIQDAIADCESDFGEGGDLEFTCSLARSEVLS